MVVRYLPAQNGYVVVVGRAASGDVVYWGDADGGPPQRLTKRMGWVNSVLLVKGQLWVAGGPPLGDPFLGSKGSISVLKLKDGMWQVALQKETEQPILALARGDDDTVFALCPSLILACSLDLATRLVYGYMGWMPGIIDSLDIAPTGRTTWRSFDQQVTFKYLRGVFLVGTPYGFVVLAPLGERATHLLVEIWIVPPGTHTQLQRDGAVRRMAPLCFQGESLKERGRREGWLQGE
jgi:hypothetical protein